MVPSFDELIFHADFEEHQSAVGRRAVTMDEAPDAWDGVRPNRRGGRGKYLMMGYPSSGRAITVVLLRTSGAGTWIGYTAWDTKESDR